MAKSKSGKAWVAWANQHAKNSDRIEDLAPGFREDVQRFVKALRDAGATVKVTSTRRHESRAYLFHWSWRIALGKAAPAEAKPKLGVEIEWDHGELARSKAGALEMVQGFGLAVPPRSVVAPSLTSNHIAGQAIDMDIEWTGDLKAKDAAGKEVVVPYLADPNHNRKLHALGATFHVKKLASDAPHWSHDGR